VLPLALIALAGCGEDGGEEAELRIHVAASPDLPATRADQLIAAAERAVGDRGGEAGGVAVAVVPATGEPAGETDRQPEEWRSATLAAAARLATEDSAAVALIGSGGREAAFSAPITNGAGMLELAPGPVPEQLLRERPGGDDVPERFQPSGTRTLGALGLRERDLPKAPARLRRELGGAGPLSVYAATLAVLDAIDRAADPLSRDSVRAAYLEASNRPTPLGELSVDPVGVASFR
jgi:hypothetical protein